MDKKKIQKQIADLQEVINDPGTPADEKEMYVKAMEKLNTKLDKMPLHKVKKSHKPGATKTKLDKQPFHDQVVKRSAESLIGIYAASDTPVVYQKIIVTEFYARLKHGEFKTPNEKMQIIAFLQDKEGYEEGDEQKYAKRGSFKAKKTKEDKKVKREKKEREKITIGGRDISEMDCEEVIRLAKERRAADQKSAEKSRSKPVMERVAKGIASAVKTTIEEIPVLDIKKDHAGYIRKFEALESKAKAFIKELKELAGESLPADRLDKAFSGLTELISELKSKHK